MYVGATGFLSGRGPPRNDLDALDYFLHPKRYVAKGYWDEALDEFRAQPQDAAALGTSQAKPRQDDAFDYLLMALIVGLTAMSRTPSRLALRPASREREEEKERLPPQRKE